MYLVGETYSVDFPVTSFVPQTNLHGVSDGFVLRIDENGTTLGYSTYLSGEGMDSIKGLTLGDNGLVYLTGSTASNSFPCSDDGFDRDFNGGVQMHM